MTITDIITINPSRRVCFVAGALLFDWKNPQKKVRNPATMAQNWYRLMKIKNSLKSLKGRHRANRMVRRRGRVYIINKVNPRFKARQG